VKTIHLPWPPTVNTYWRNVPKRGVLISKRGRQYRDQVVSSAPTLPKFGEARLSVSITAYPPDRRKRDLDNLFKAVLDSLAKAGVYDDDSQIDHLAICRGDVVKGGRAEVTIQAIPG
jgi:crossover junction endodeoxyribonuclease RusA